MTAGLLFALAVCLKERTLSKERKDGDKQTCGGIAVDSVLAQLEAATKTPQAFQSYMRCTA